jgi:hypothetical protein
VRDATDTEGVLRPNVVGSGVVHLGVMAGLAGWDDLAVRNHAVMVPILASDDD